MTPEERKAFITKLAIEEWGMPEGFVYDLSDCPQSIKMDGAPDPIPANSSHSEAPAAPTPLPPVLDPLNWKELPDDQDPLQLCQTLHDLVDYWRERALKAEKKLED